MPARGKAISPVPKCGTVLRRAMPGHPAVAVQPRKTPRKAPPFPHFRAQPSAIRTNRLLLQFVTVCYTFYFCNGSRRPQTSGPGSFPNQRIDAHTPGAHLWIPGVIHQPVGFSIRAFHNGMVTWTDHASGNSFQNARAAFAPF